MISKQDITRLQTAVTSQQAGNDWYGAIGLKGGWACTDTGGVLGSPVGPFTIVPAPGGNTGAYRAYLNFPAGAVQSIDYAMCRGFTPRDPDGVETCDALITGYNIDTANNQYYVTVQVVTLGTWALNATPPTNFVIGLEVAVTFSSQANPL